MNRKEKYAFGWPGLEAKWTSSSKSGVGTSVNPVSKVWFSLNYGILNEVYYPQVDQACTRDFSFIVTDGESFFSDEKRHTNHHIKTLAKGVPGYHITNQCKMNFYRIEKEVISDPERDTIIQKIQFYPTRKKYKNLKIFALLAPHLCNSGSGNTAWIGNYKGTTMLYAKREDASLAMTCSVPWKKTSAGFVGYSDGWQDLMLHKYMKWEFERAENGNVALTGEIDLEESENNQFVIALGFGRSPEEAAHRAQGSIFDHFETAKNKFISEWENWHNKLYIPENSKKYYTPKFFKISASMLKTHESKRHPGGLIASLSIPWGFSKGDDDLGGYHLVWPRDMVQIAGGLLAVKAYDEAKRVLKYLMITQEADGHWAQNMWLEGVPYWKGIQMDQTALPILLFDLINKENLLNETELKQFWPMIKKAAIFLIINGPLTQQDRWEENAGFSTYTLAVEIAALLIAAEHAEINSDHQLGDYLKIIADSWNDSIERWTYVTSSDLGHSLNVDGYYVRINPSESESGSIKGEEYVNISNRKKDESKCKINEMVSPDSLALVRYGLRDAKDPRILNTIKVIDSTLMLKQSKGSLWYRYNGDGYGEHKDGSPFNGTGIGRPWPLLTGERGHYEIAAGNISNAEEYLKTMENYSNETGMIPEQIWDADDIPDAGLHFGKASGSAMPLVWAHAEYIKLSRSIRLKKIFDMPSLTFKRYVIDKNESTHYVWNEKIKYKYLPFGKSLRIQSSKPMNIVWHTEKTEKKETASIDSGYGYYYADIPNSELKEYNRINFKINYHDDYLGVNEYFLEILKNEKENNNNNFKDINRIKVYYPS